MTTYDVIVVGGGPAGSTVATLVKKYSPQLKVLLLEKATFPRHHVGESLLAGASPVLRDMGVYDRINNYGFIEKSGATYIWGHERQPWGFDFDQALKPLLNQELPLPEMYTKGWQVRRAEYDHELLKHAVEMGVAVREGARVTRVMRDAGDPLTARLTGVEYRDDRGTYTVNCQWLMDCTGQAALIGHDLNLREYDAAMNNYALYGYWRDFNWNEDWLGHRDFTRIFLATSPHGWFWCIPASPDLMSIGLVTNRETLATSRLDPFALYYREIQACPEIAAILAGATITRLSADQSRDVLATQDWSYSSRQLTGPGWALAGDAAGFVDPILSSGVMIAHELGQKAAYTINTMFQSSSDAAIDRLWDHYARTYRTFLRAYQAMAAFWYRNNFVMEGWWWQAQRLAPPNTLAEADSSAFMRLASGYANRAESLSLFGSYPIQEARQLVNGLFGVPLTDRQLADDYTERSLRLTENARLESGMYYFQGFVRQTGRICNTQTGDSLDLHPAEQSLLRLFDGQHTLADLDQQISIVRANGNHMSVRSGLELLVQLDSIGVLE